MPLKVKHHYVPVMQLQRFTDSDGLVWVHDRQQRFTPRRDTPRNVANEKFLYAPGSGSESPRSDAFEDWLANHIDGPAAPAISLVLESGKPELDNSSRSGVAAFVAAQDLRTPKVRDFLMSEFQKGLQREWPGVIRASLEAIGEQASPEAIAAVSDAYEVSLNKSVWLDFLGEHVNKSAKRLHQMAWSTIAAPPGSTFLLNDVGVLKFTGGFHQPVPYRPGWWLGPGVTPITHWMIPLSPTLALAISPEQGYATGTAKPEGMKLLNRQTVIDAHDYVFSSQPNPDIENLWSQP